MKVRKGVRKADKFGSPEETGEAGEGRTETRNSVTGFIDLKAGILCRRTNVLKTLLDDNRTFFVYDD